MCVTSINDVPKRMDHIILKGFTGVNKRPVPPIRPWRDHFLANLVAILHDTGMVQVCFLVQHGRSFMVDKYGKVLSFPYR